MSALVIKPVSSARDRRRFQRLPWSIYADDPKWVPPLLGSEAELLGWRGHPFYDHAEVSTLLAERDGTPIGRVAVLINHVHNRRHNERRGFFGFFECIDDVDVAGKLLDAGETWLRRRGARTVRGPVNPSLNHTCGLLVRGHDTPPRILMTYNPPYYETLLHACGYATAQDLFSYEMGTNELVAVIERYKRATTAAANRVDVHIRPFDPSRFDEEVRTYLDIYNRAMDDTWSFVPLQPREAERIARDLRHVLVPELARFVEVGGKAAGAVLALLDYNQVLRKLNGRLFPLGFVRVLMERRRIDAVRTMAMTMAPEYRQAGLGTALLSSVIPSGAARGIKQWEFSWVLESNSRSRRPLEKCGMGISKVYRLYDKSL